MNRSSSLRKVKKYKLFFYLSIIVLPMIQFLVFYVGVNANSFMLAFKDYNYVEGKLTSSFVGFDNFAQVIKDLGSLPVFKYAWKNSIIYFVFGAVVTTPITLLFSYYIYKKRAGYKFFKILLYLPSIVSVMVLAVMFNYFTQKAIPLFADKVLGVSMEGYADKYSNAMILMLTFNLITSFSGTLIYSGTMAGISESTLEAAQLDGANAWQEFLHAVFPYIYPTFTTFFVVGLAGIFTNQANLFNFYSYDARNEMYTFGYYTYVRIYFSANDYTQYPYLSAFGISLMMIALPITLVVRWAMQKFGPSVD